MNKSLKIVIANENNEELQSIEDELDAQGYSIIGKAKTGIELEKLMELKPDIVILDILLSGKDGFCIMEKYAKTNIKFIVTTVLSSQTFVQKAMSLGASYYMIKPIDCKVLVSRINDLFIPRNDIAAEYKEFAAELSHRNKQLEEKITNIFITVGIPAHIKGYQFLREAIKMAIKNPEIINSITKELYPSIASRFDTSASKVERAIRHAIEVAWNRGKIENINSVFGIKVYSNNEKPTNGEFIALVADKMLLEG